MAKAAGDGCSFGCGNRFEYVIVTRADGTSLFLCVPCFLHLAVDMANAVNDGLPPEAQNALREIESMEQAPVAIMTGGSFEDDDG